MEITNRGARFDPPVLLSIAGSDSFAGAGIQADIKTASALGAYCCTAITAITSQNAVTVNSIWQVPKIELENQLMAVANGVALKAIKIGMLGSPEAVEVVANFLDKYSTVPVVLDPVFKSSSGSEFASHDVIAAMSEQLFTKVSLLTPNLFEAARILNCEPAANLSEMEDQAKALMQCGLKAVLLKGGHLQQTENNNELITDVFVTDKKLQHFEARKIKTAHTHGTGCSLSTAIAVEIAKGSELVDAIKIAKTYVTNAIAYATQGNIVSHNGPLNHFYHLKYKVRV